MYRVLIAAVILVANGTAHAQDKPEPRVPVSVKLQIVFERYQGEKRLSSEPYTIALNANDRPGRIRMGVTVPMRMDRVNEREVPGNVVYRDVGNGADCTVTTLDAARFKVDCTFDQSSIASTQGAATLVPPMLRSFRAEAGLILRNKESAQFTVGTDPVSGERLQVSLTLMAS